MSDRYESSLLGLMHELRSLLKEIRVMGDHREDQTAHPKIADLLLVVDRLEQWSIKQQATARYAKELIKPILAFAERVGWETGKQSPDPLKVLLDKTLNQLGLKESLVTHVRELQEELHRANEALTDSKEEHHKTLAVLDDTVLGKGRPRSKWEKEREQIKERYREQR